MNKVVVASDSFKGCLSSLEVADSVAKGIHCVYPHCDVLKVNVADGGEGTTESIVSALGGTMLHATVHDPLGRVITARYGIAKSGDILTAVMDISATSGLSLLKAEEQNPTLTSSYGTGELIIDALNRGCRRFLIGIGGSATNDAGVGMLTALGFKFLDADACPLKGCGETMIKICSIDSTDVSPELKQSEFIVACDVDTPFCGLNGAAYVFAPQKGASPEMVEELDRGMRSLAEVIKRFYHTDIIPIEGAGAAGGLGAAFKVFLNARLTKGVDMVLDVVGFDEMLEGADLVITGEGKIDNQTPMGKTAYGVLRRAKLLGIPVIAIGGCVEYSETLQMMGFDGVYCINEPNTPLEQALQREYAMDRITQAIHSILPFDGLLL